MRCVGHLRITRVLAGALCSLLLSGCPLALSDDFHVLGASAVDSGAAANDAGSVGGHINGTNVNQAGTNIGGTSGTGGLMLTNAGGTAATNIGGTGAINTGGTSAINTGGTSAVDTRPLSADPCTWGTPESVAGLSVSGSESGPTLSQLALIMYFGLHEGSTDSIYRAQRANVGADFQAAAATTITGVTGSIGSPYLSHDSLTMYFVRWTTGATIDKDIWVTSRPSTGDPFANTHALPGVNSTSDEIRPWVSSDQLTLLFASSRPGGAGDFDIYMATRTAPGDDFGKVANLSSINTAASEDAAALTDDGLTLYFSSGRAGGAGGQDIYVATRPNTRSDFYQPVPVTDLNTNANETDFMLVYDETEAFYASDASGTSQLWHVTRFCQ